MKRSSIRRPVRAHSRNASANRIRTSASSLHRGFLRLSHGEGAGKRVLTRSLSEGLVLVLLMLLLAACGGDSDGASQAEPRANAQGLLPAQPVSGAAQAQPTSEPLAARVNGQPITLAAFQREVQRRMIGMTLEPATQAAFDASVLDAMIDQVLIEQGAALLQIEVTDAEVDAELTIQADLAKANNLLLEEVLAAQLYTLDEYREVVRGMLLVQKLSDVVAAVAPYAEQVHSRHILVADEATARALIDQLRAGADFAQLAATYSLDQSTAPSGGDLGWVAPGVLLQPEVEAAIFALAPGELAPEPVQSSLGYHVVQTLERVQDRPLSPAELAERRQQVFEQWLETQRQAAVIERLVATGN